MSLLMTQQSTIKPTPKRSLTYAYSDDISFTNNDHNYTLKRSPCLRFQHIISLIQTNSMWPISNPPSSVSLSSITHSISTTTLLRMTSTNSYDMKNSKECLAASNTYTINCSEKVQHSSSHYRQNSNNINNNLSPSLSSSAEESTKSWPEPQ